MYHFCSYFDRHYVARGLALYRSLARHAGAFKLYVLCMDRQAFAAVRDLDLPNLIPISLDQFEQGDDALLAAKANRTLIEYYFTCTPSLPLYVMNHFPDVDVVTYLDADLFFFGDPKPVFDELGDRSVLIARHRFPPGSEDLERFGIFNVGLLSFRNDESGRACVTWWRERCLEWCYDRVEDGRFADQKYLDDWPTRFDNVVVLQNKGAGLGPWNVAGHERRNDGGSLVVGDDRLIFYHFHALKRVSACVYDTGLQNYGVSMDSSLRTLVYAPYVRELQDTERQAAAAGIGRRSLASVLARSAGLGSWLRKVLLFVAGPASLSFTPLPRTGLVAFSRRAMGRVQAKDRLTLVLLHLSITDFEFLTLLPVL